MDFKTHKIRKKLPEIKTLDQIKSARKLKINIPIITAIVIIALLTAGIVKAISSIGLSTFLEFAGDKLQTDPYNHTNFLILGTAGKEHEGGNLTDTMIVASLDNDNKLITMISIPRDLYVKDEEIGNSKINEVYYKAKTYLNSSSKGVERLKEKIEEMMGIPIHYWVTINFDGFKELIDALGGIDIYVEDAIYDPYYPKDGTFDYETFSISAGQHHLDGETALKYARSRKTTSDFDRANRQQQIIYAVKEKALETETILDLEKIKELLNTIKSNIETNIKVKEILTLGAFAKDFKPENIIHRLIHDDPTKCGGFLYTPERTYYDGMFVLIPAGGFEFIQGYADLNFNTPKIAKENAKIHILNGTGTPGIAAETKQILQRYCFNVTRFGNANSKDIKQTTYYYKEKTDENGEKIKSRPESLDFLKKMIPGKESSIIPEEYKQFMLESDILIEIGSDYTTSGKYIEDPFYSLPSIKPATNINETQNL